MDRNRLLELAIEALKGQKAAIEDEIESLRSQIKDIQTPEPEKTAPLMPIKKRGKSAAERKAQSEKMKKIWADRKSKKQKGKGKAATAKPAKTKAALKGRSKTETEKKALSLKMKEVWKKKKAAAQKAQVETEGTKTTKK